MKRNTHISRLKIRILLILVASASLSGCCHQPKSPAFRVEHGDLLFQDSDCGDFCRAIREVTYGYGGHDFTHIGIAVEAEGGFEVIEAVSAGVKVTALEDFLTRSTDAGGSPRAAVGRLKEPLRHLIPPAIDHAQGLIGKPYDWWFELGNGKYYCSELIYEIFRQANDGQQVFSPEPMTFRPAPEEDFFDLWADYFADLGTDIPQGMPGLNPAGMSRSQVLDIVYIYPGL